VVNAAFAAFGLLPNRPVHPRATRLREAIELCGAKTSLNRSAVVGLVRSRPRVTGISVRERLHIRRRVSYARMDV
jgi:hypothetical protein